MASAQTTLFPPEPQIEHLDIPALETWLWDAACAVRGAADAPKFKDFILPLVFFKRLSDVFDDEFAAKVEEFGDEEVAREVIRADHEDALKTGRDDTVVRFYLPNEYRWQRLRNHPQDGKLGEFVTTAMREVARLNPDLQGVLDVKDYNERQSGQRTLDDDRLAALIEVVSRHRLGLQNAQPDILGRAYEYLLRKFAEGQGQSAGEFYTPKEVGFLMAQLLQISPYSTVYDPTCGSGGLLIKARMQFVADHPDKATQAPQLFGQELNPVTFAIAKMNMFLHGYTDASFGIGDTLSRPAFGAQGAGLQKFDFCVANPMWNQDNYPETFYAKDTFKRFERGTPPASSADWGWVQHIKACLKNTGRAAVVLDTGAVSRGSGSKSSNKEKTIRQKFVEADLVEGVVLLPENLFYNTTAPGIVLLLNCHKRPERREQIILINASKFFRKEKPKNVLTDDGIAAVVEVFRSWETREKLSKVVTLDEAVKADFNLSPSQFVDVNEKITHRPIFEILSDLEAAQLQREQADAALRAVLQKLHLQTEEVVA